MKYEIRRLDPKKDGALFVTVFEWLLAAPEWLQTSEGIDPTVRITSIRNPANVFIGIFVEGELSAVVSLTLTGKHIYEVSLEARRGTNLELIALAGCEIRDQMFRYGMQCAYTWTPRWNRPVLAVNKAIGFQPDNVSMWRGSVGDRTMEWVRYSLVNPLYRAA